MSISLLVWAWYTPNLCCIIVLMEKDTQTDTNLMVLPENQQTYELYALWKSLPINILKTIPEEQMQDKMGIDDPFVLDLVKIHSQKDFAQKYSLDETTLVRWNKLLMENDPLYQTKDWARNLTKNVMLSFYNHTVRKGNPLLFKLWFQVINDWEESSKIKFAPGGIEFNFSQMPKRGEVKKAETVEPQAIDAEAKEVKTTNAKKARQKKA